MKKWLISIACLVLLQVDGYGQINYHLKSELPNSHVLNISMTVATENDSSLFVRMPAWRPGRYVLQNFARNVIKFTAQNPQDEALPFRKTDKDTWRISTGGAESVTVFYDYFANEYDAGNSFVDDREIYLNPITCFMYVPGREMEKIELNIAYNKDWLVATAMEFEPKKQQFRSPNYHEFADNPILISPDLDIIEFEFESKPHQIAILGDYFYERDSIKSDFVNIQKATVELFGQVPYQKYVYFLHLVNWRMSHGVEHKNATSLFSGPANFRSDGYLRSLRGLVTHEYFHVWNVERIRPERIFLPDYSKESYSRTLWFFEGVTSYYTPVLLNRAGLITPKKFIKEFELMINRDRQHYGNLVQSAAESSWENWTHSVGRRPPHALSNMYSRGKAIGFVLDLTIRHQTENQKSLDDVLRYLDAHFGQKQIGMPEDGIKAAVEEISGVDYSEFFRKYVNGTEPLPFKQCLEYAGYELLPDSSKDSTDTFLGLSLQRSSDKFPAIRSILPQSPAALGGLDMNDVIVAINGTRVDGDELETYLLDFQPDDMLTFTVMRGRMLREIEVKLGTKPALFREVKIKKMKTPTPLQKALQTTWALEADEPEEEQTDQ